MRVLLVVIDGAAPHVVCPAVRTGHLPVLAQLAEAGTLHEGSVSIFPSITPAATATIITGAYPVEHGIAGASWFDEDRGEIAYYGDDFWAIARRGFGAFVREFLIRLNGDRLTAPTLFHLVERTGRTAASLNYLVFRGMAAHPVRIPALLKGLPEMPAGLLEGPSILSVGDFAETPAVRGRRLRDRSGVLHRFGMDDEATGTLLVDLAARGLPDLTVAYFADNDFRSHAVGPVGALGTIERVDRMLGAAFEAAGGLERVLEETCVIVTSDHGHCDVLEDHTRAAIRLDEILINFQQASISRGWTSGDEVLICPNMRAAQIYLRDPALIELIAADLLADDRIDQVIWRTGEVHAGEAGYTVLTARGRLEFAESEESHWSATDPFGGTWTWRGDPEALDFDVAEHTIEFGQYPNAFERIAGSLDLDQTGEMWVTARPGFEFDVPGGNAHTGGSSHGALHALDSLSPVVMAGGPVRPRLPRHMRSVDIAPLCMEALGMTMRYRPGDTRAPLATRGIAIRR